MKSRVKNEKCVKQKSKMKKWLEDASLTTSVLLNRDNDLNQQKRESLPCMEGLNGQNILPVVVVVVVVVVKNFLLLK